MCPCVTVTVPPTGLDVVKTFTTELKERRGVQLNSYLMDDGWDNHSSLWHFHDGWPVTNTSQPASHAPARTLFPLPSPPTHTNTHAHTHTRARTRERAHDAWPRFTC